MSKDMVSRNAQGARRIAIEQLVGEDREARGSPAYDSPTGPGVAFKKPKNMIFEAKLREISVNG